MIFDKLKGVKNGDKIFGGDDLDKILMEAKVEDLFDFHGLMDLYKTIMIIKIYFQLEQYVIC